MRPGDVCNEAINLVRDVLIQVKGISDEVYFEAVLLRNDLQLAAKAKTTKEYDGKHIALNKFGKLLTQLALFKQDTDPLAAVSMLRLALALKEDVLEPLVPLCIYTGNLSCLGLVKEYGMENIFVSALLAKDYHKYEELLRDNATDLVISESYQFYARGLLMIKKLCLDSGDLKSLPEGKRDVETLREQTKQILCGNRIIELKNILQPAPLEIEETILNIVNQESVAKVKTLMQKLSEK